MYFSFLKDKSFLDKYEKDAKYQNAFFKILGDYCYEYIQDKDKYKSTPNFDDTKYKVVSLNDTIQEFIDNSLVITNDDNDRIDRKEMYELFTSFNPKTIMKDTQLLSSLGQKGIQFSYKKRVNGTQGAYTGVKVKESKIENDLDYGVQQNPIDENQQMIISQREEITELKNKIKELELLLRQQDKQEEKIAEPEQKNKNKSLIKQTNIKEEIKEILLTFCCDNDFIRVANILNKVNYTDYDYIEWISILCAYDTDFFERNYKTLLINLFEDK